MTVKETLQVLLHEHQNINHKIDQFINDQFRYITTLITLSAGFIYFSFQSNDAETRNLIIYLPYLLIIIAPTFLFKFNRVIILHGYRGYLEDQINKLSETPLLFGAQIVKEKLLHKNFFSIANYSVLGSFFVASTLICHTATDCFHASLVHLVIQLIVIVLGFLIFFLKNMKAYQAGYDFANRTSNTEQTISS